jgi:hypothetical protein
MDRYLWDGEIGDSLRSIFTQSYPMLPQSEPMFKLLNISYDNFSRQFQRHRNLIIINKKIDQKEAKSDILHDIYANPQIVINISGHDERSILQLLDEQRNKLLLNIEQAELDRQSNNVIKYEDAVLRETVEKKFGIRIFIPKGYQLFNTPQHANFLWCSNRNTYVDMGLFIYTYPINGDSTFTVNYLVNKRNEFLKQYVPGAIDSSWMTTSSHVAPSLETRTYKGQTYCELKGLWEVENDFMGGPFINRSYIDKNKRRIITVEGYVYAPRYDKRDYMRRLEGIINTLIIDYNTDVNI